MINTINYIYRYIKLKNNLKKKPFLHKPYICFIRLF